jgi:hypothetical protein
MKRLLNLASLATLALVATMSSCKKDTVETPAPTPGGYNSLAEFYSANRPAMMTYTVSGTSGGSFTTPQGTTVTIPPNAFVTQSNVPVTGSVTIEFLDVYKKSDMLFCDRPTTMYWGTPIKSAGEFFIKASADGDALLVAAGQQIDVEQPLQAGELIDTGMVALIGVPDSAGGAAWAPDPNMSLVWNQSGYIFSLYQFGQPADSGSWCNSDNQWFFSAYPQTSLTLHANDDPAEYTTDVFLIFNTINSMIHVYQTNVNDYQYWYAPVGLSCTVVAIGAKDGKLYSSFTPVTISVNQTVNITLTETTEADFKTALEALN